MIQEKKHIFSKKNNMTFPLSKMTPENQYNLAGELSNSNNGINLCFKMDQKSLVKYKSLLGVEQFSQSSVTVKKREPEMRIEETPHQNIISFMVIFPLFLPTLENILRNIIESMVSHASLSYYCYCLFPLFF